MIFAILLKPLMQIDRVFLRKNPSVMVLEEEKTADGCFICWMRVFRLWEVYETS